MKKIVEVQIIDPSTDINDRKAVAQALDEEILIFESWMTKSLGGGLSKFEKAIVKTYLYQKVVGRIDDLEHYSVTPDS